MHSASHPHRSIHAVAAAAALVAVSAPAEGKGGTKEEPPTIVEAYEAQYGSWTVSCDPCASYEDSVCSVWTRPDAGEIWIFPTDESNPRPPLAMSYFPERELAFGTEGTLTASVDGAQVQVITPPDLILSEMYGDLYIETEAAMALLPQMRTGATLTLEFVDADGSDPDNFILDGLGDAMADLQRHLPFPRRPYDDTQPDSCPY